MSAVGRNEPCPCGSGRKFKKCCLNKSGTVWQSYSAAERDSALAKLMRFARREEFREMDAEAMVRFWGDWLEEEPDEQLQDVMDSEQADIAYHTWFIFDFNLGEGTRILDLFLRKEAGKLSSGEQRYLEGMRDSHLRLYEVLEVKPEEGFQLRDLWDDRHLWVRERLGTRQIVQWDVVVGRTAAAGGGETVFETLPYVFPAWLKDELVAGLKKAHQKFARELPDENIVGFFRFMAPIWHKVWLDQVALTPFPKLLTAEGDPVIFAKAIFELFDAEAVKAALRDRLDIVDHGDGSYGWVETAGELQRSLGTIVVEERRLILETTSQTRAERGRDFLQDLLGATVKFKAISYEDVRQAMKRAPARENRESPRIPAELEAEVAGRYYETHYRKWLDEPVPALGNRTPRHAAKLKTMRPKLIALLKDFESKSERQRRAGKPAYDFSWIWKELGLARE